GLRRLRHLEALVHRRGGGVVGVAGLRRLNRADADGDHRHGRTCGTRYRADQCRLRVEAYRQAGTGGRADREWRRTERLVREWPEGDGLRRLRHLEALAHRRGGRVVGVAGLRRLNGAGADGDQRHRGTGYRADRRRLRVEAYRQAGGSGRADREWRRTERLVRERPEADGLASLRHLEALVHRRGGGVVGVAGLRRLDGAGADGDQRHRGTRYRADRCRLRVEAYRQAGTGGRADREWRRTERLVRECPEGDGLASLRHLEALVHRRGRRVVGVARLRRLNRAGADGDQRHRGARYRADQCRLRVEAYRQAGTGRCADRKWRRTERLVRECPEGDGLRRLRHLEALV